MIGSTSSQKIKKEKKAMKQRTISVFALCLGLALASGLVFGLALARSQDSPTSETAPNVISYQGEVQVDGEPYSGMGYFKFAFVNTAGTTTYWSNDSTSINGGEPTNAEELSVENGLFAILLGNSAPPYFMPAINASVFADKGRRLHVWFDADGSGTFTDLGLTVVAAVPYAMNAETLDGKDGSYYDRRYEHLLVVAKSGGDYTTINDALDNISDNGPESRYLVWVAPGVYTETVTMKEYVDIEGAGEQLTTISYVGDAGASTGTVLGASNAELRFLTVRNTGGATYARAIYNSHAAVRLTHVTASVSGGTNDSAGVFNNDYSAAILDHVTASGSGGTNAFGIYNTSYSTATLTSVTASASGANTNNRAVINLNSQVTMVDVTASAYGNAATAVYNYQATVTMTRVTASATGSGWNYGISIDSTPSTITEVIASASGGTHNYGIRIFNSSATIRNSQFTAGADTTYSTGLSIGSNSGTYTIKMDNCQIKGDAQSIDNGSSNYTLYVGTSMLDGTATGSGTYHCVFAYDETYNGLNSSCQ
jgi:pectin methylesterase-like acyl-CoA thioesterase